MWPWLAATSQCSSRSRRPWMALSYSQLSPAAKMPGAELSSPAEQRIPPVSPSSSPAERASITSGVTPDPDDHEVAVELAPGAGDHLRHAAVGALEAVELVPAVQLDAVVLEHAVEEARDLLAELALERHLLEHHDRALDPVRGGERCGHLAGDVAAADQHHPLGLLGIGADRVRVGERAQVVDAVEVAAVHAQAPDVGAGGQQRLAEPHRLLGRERRHALGGVELHHARPGQQLHAAARPTSPRGGRARRRGSPPRAGSPSRAAAGCRAGRAPARPSGCCRRRPPRAASARSSRRPGRRRPADSRPNGRARVRPRAPRGW